MKKSKLILLFFVVTFSMNCCSKKVDVISMHEFQDKILDNKEYKKIQKNINKIVFSNVIKYNGSISAEHGIGQLRRKELKKFKSDDEIKKMVQIKKIFDPKGIMNPGKII